MQFWDGYDLVLTPALAKRPVRHGEIDPCGENPAYEFKKSGEFTPYTAPFNVTGQPAISVPLYQGDDGLPLAVQLVGAPLGEGTLLQVCRQLEEALPWADRRPPNRHSQAIRSATLAPLRKGALALATAALAVACGNSYAAELAGRTTVQQRVGGGDPSQGFQFLTQRAGESHLVRQERVGSVVADRARRRRSLLYFAQLSDFQLADEESPARVEFVDLTANPPSTSVFSAAQRPQEALVAQAAEASSAR